MTVWHAQNPLHENACKLRDEANDRHSQIVFDKGSCVRIIVMVFLGSVEGSGVDAHDGIGVGWCGVFGEARGWGCGVGFVGWVPVGWHCCYLLMIYFLFYHFRSLLLFWLLTRIYTNKLSPSSYVCCIIFMIPIMSNVIYAALPVVMSMFSKQFKCFHFECMQGTLWHFEEHALSLSFPTTAIGSRY